MENPFKWLADKMLGNLYDENGNLVGKEKLMDRNFQDAKEVITKLKEQGIPDEEIRAKIGEVAKEVKPKMHEKGADRFLEPSRVQRFINYFGW